MDLDLRTYINTMGDEAAAKLLGISVRAARSYRTGWRLPRPDKANSMVKRSKGKLTLEAIYGK